MDSRELFDRELAKLTHRADIATQLAEALEYVLQQVHDCALDQVSARRALSLYHGEKNE